MTRLLLDVGNSRLKYAFDGGPMAAVAHDGDVPAAVRAVLAQAGQPDEIGLVDVTGAAAAALAPAVVRQLRAGAAACGVRNAYPQPERLGDDRWAALIGARRVHEGACGVVDAGSALTFDVLADDGRHLGGWIAPGRALSWQALAAGTRGARGAPVAPPDGPATDTAAAIQGGVLHAALGFVERARRAACEALGVETLPLLVTGGDGPALAARLPDATLRDDLVLRGLAAWLAGR